MNKKKKRVFFVSIHKTGKVTEEIFPDPSRRLAPRYLTIGDKPDCDIIASLPGISGRYRLIEKGWAGYILRIPAGMEGAIIIGNNTLSIKGMIESNLLKKRGDCYLFPLPARKICILKVDKDFTFTFGCKEIALPEKKTVKLESSLRRPLIVREDYTFFLILIISTAIHFSTVGYLNSIEIKKEEPMEVIRNISPRFAKLIFQPPEEKIIEKTPIKPIFEEEEERKEEKKEIEKEEEPPPPVVEEEVIPPAPEEPTPPVTEEVAILFEPEEPPPLPVTKEETIINQTEKVKSRGLLGVIMAKRGPSEIPGDDIFREAEVDGLIDIKRARSEENMGDILSNLNVKASQMAEDVSRSIIVNPPPMEVRVRDTSEILTERKEILREEIEEIDKDDEVIDLLQNRKRGEAEVYKTVVSYVAGLKYLYNNALRKNPYLKGKITVKLTIAPNGKVIKAEIISSTLHSPGLEEAIINKIYKWRFNKLKVDENYTIPYTFDFALEG